MATPNINSASDYESYLLAQSMTTNYYQKERDITAQAQNLVQNGATKESIELLYKKNNMNVPSWVASYVPNKRVTCVDSSRSNSSVEASISNRPSTSNITTSPRISYTSHIAVQYSPDNGITVIDIEPEKISYLMHEYRFDDAQIPGLFMGLYIGNSLYTSMVDNKSTGIFRITITIKPAEAPGIISKVILDKIFTYIPSTDNPNYSQDLTTDEYFSDAYKRLTVALIDNDLTNQGRKSYNGIYNNISTMTVLGAAIENTRFPVVELPKYNDIFDTLIVPPLTTRMQLIQYIYDKKAFYDTKFRFFMDYDKTYLISKSGAPVSTGEGLPENIIIDIRALTDDEAFIDGQQIKDGSYYIFVNPANSNILQQQSTEQVANQIITVSDDGNTNTANLVINSTINNDAKPIYIRDDDAAIYKNALEEDTLGIQIIKQHIDPTIFTINKSITISNYGKYIGYDGNYIISSRRDFYRNISGGEFSISCILTLRKVGTITPSRNLESNPNVQSFAPKSTAEKDTINPSATSAAQTASRSTSSQQQAKNTVNAQQTNVSKQSAIDASKMLAAGGAGAPLVASYRSSQNSRSSAQVTSTASQANRTTVVAASRALTPSTAQVLLASVRK